MKSIVHVPRRKTRYLGFTLVEVVIALFLSLGFLTAILSAFVQIQSSSKLTRHTAQALNVARGAVENLKKSDFEDLATLALPNTSYDAGPDGVFGNGDDLRGTLTILVEDARDYDADGVVNESWIDVDGDGINDDVARPVRVTFTWPHTFLNQQRNVSVFLDTLVAQ